MIPRELLKKVRQIEIRTSRRVTDVLAGQYHSVFKGHGMEFEEVRPYQIGDDVRRIDWNVSARYGAPFVKLFREERELTVLLLVDVSGSQGFGTREQLKRELVAELCATVAFSAIRNNDKVGLNLFTDRVEKVVPTRKGATHVLRVIRELLVHEPVGRRTDVRVALEHLNHVTKRRAVVFIVSDFLDGGAYEHPLRIARRRHDVIPVVVEDVAERVLPNVGLFAVRDAETERTLVIDTASRTVRDAYAVQAMRREQERERLGIESIRIETGGSIDEPLKRYFRARGRRL